MKNGFRILLVLVLVSALFACKQGKGVRQIPINDFFKSQDRATYRLSPDGKFISYLKLENRKNNLFVEEIEGGKQTKITNVSDRNLSYYFWVSNEEMIYFQDEPGKRNSVELFIVGKDGKSKKILGAENRSTIKVLDDKLIDSTYLLIQSNQRDSTIMDVYRLNVRNGKMLMTVKNPGNFSSWLTDDKGKLRMAISSDGVNEALWYRETEQLPFKQIMVNNFKTTLLPVAFAKDKANTIYAISNVNRDKNALVEVDCLTGKEKSVLFYNDTLNVVDAKYSALTGKMDYVVYETWKKEKVYLNNASKAMYEKMDKLLPKTESRIIDEDLSENVFVLRTFTDRNPGSYYLYNASGNSLKKLTDINPSIDEAEMCDMQAISFTSRDGIKINGYLTLPKGDKKTKLPVVVVPHNGPDLRNTWGYNADVQFLANRGYAVLQVNYRGSTGYGKSFYAEGFKQWGAKVQNDIDDAVNWLIENETADPQKVAIYGYGFGGNIALNCAIRSPQLYKCAASNTGILNVFSFLKSIPPFFKTRLAMYYDIIGNPDTDTEYIRQASPVFHADKIKIPILVTQHANDPRVNPNDAVQFVRELKKRKVPVTYFEQAGEGATGRDENRLKVYGALEQFLQANLNKK